MDDVMNGLTACRDCAKAVGSGSEVRCSGASIERVFDPWEGCWREKLAPASRYNNGYGPCLYFEAKDDAAE